MFNETGSFYYSPNGDLSNTRQRMENFQEKYHWKQVYVHFLFLKQLYVFVYMHAIKEVEKNKEYTISERGCKDRISSALFIYKSSAETRNIPIIHL